MGRVNRKRAQKSLDARHRSTRFHRATRFRAFRSVLKGGERLPDGFMKNLRWSTPHLGHHREASQKNARLLPKGYLTNHAGAPRYVPVGNRTPQNKQKASKSSLFSSRKTRVRRHNARNRSLPHPNYMGISPAILLEMMVKVAKVKWKPPSVLGNGRTKNSIMLQAAMSKESPTMVSVKNIEGIQQALSFLNNLPENRLPTFVQRNSVLKRFIRGMETHNTSAASGNSEKPKNDLGIKEQTVYQLQRRGLVKPYLDKLTAYSSEQEDLSADAETLMQKVLVDATNSAALTPCPREGEVDMTMMDSNEQNAPKLHLDTSQKCAVISLQGSRCNPINLENLGLPRDLFRELPNPFLDRSSNVTAINPINISQGQPDAALGKRPRIVFTRNPELLDLCPEEAAMHWRFDRTLYVRAPDAAIAAIAALPPCHHAPCMYITCENYLKKRTTSPFRESPMLGGPGGQYMTTPFNFGDHVEGVQFYQAAINAKRTRKLELERQKTAQKAAEDQKYKRPIDRYSQALQQSRLAEGQPNWHDLPYPAISREEMSSLELELTEADKSVAHRMLIDEIVKDTPEQRKKLEEYDIRTLFPELQPIQHEFEENGYSELREVKNEPTKSSEKSIAKDHCSKKGQSGHGLKRRRAFPEEEPRPQYSNFELEIDGPLLNGPPIFRPRSPSQMSTSSKSDVFVDCEEEISLVRSSAPKGEAEPHPEIYRDEVMLRYQLASGPVYTQNPNLYSTYSSSLPKSTECNQYPTRTNRAIKEPISIFAGETAFSNLTIADMQPNSMSGTGFPSETSPQAALSTDSILFSGSPFAPTSLAGEPMVADSKSCPKCEKPYKYKGAFTRHMQNCQVPGIPEEYKSCQVPGIPEESPLPHSCPTCGKIYKKLGNLWPHIVSCNSKNNKFQTTEFSKQDIGEVKARGSLVPFPRDNARTSSGKPFCEACRSEFTSKRELAKHIKAECAALRAQGSYGRKNNKQPGTPLALSFKEPMSASDFESSDSESVAEMTSSIFATSIGKYGQNSVRAERQSTKGDAFGMDCAVRKGSIAEQMELIYGPQSNYHTPTNPMSYYSSNIMKNPALGDYSGTGGVRNGDDSDMDASPTPETKSHNIGKLSKFASTVRPRRPPTRIGMSPGSKLTVDGETPSVSRVRALDPGLSELHDTKPQPTSRKLFSHDTGVAGMSSPLFPTIQDEQAFKPFDLDFPPLSTRFSPHKDPATHRSRLSKEFGPYRSKLGSFGSEVITVRCSTQIVCDKVVNFLGKFKAKDARRQIVSVSGENGFTAKVIVRPGFDITEIKFAELPGIFVESENKKFIFAQTDPETLGARVGKDTGEKHELELGTPGEKPVDRTRGWNLRGKHGEETRRQKRRR
ncbi:hypothetical protein VE04_07765 [Pseudogymnoascus sp. 24MN13]|nr:hypothetical protein VE04_07765 [Pseudogymnoascus sp. 24MN13]